MVYELRPNNLLIITREEHVVFRQQFVRIFMVSVFGLVFYSERSPAEQSPACYEFNMPNSAAREFPAENKLEIWCYKNLTNSKKLFIYNADTPKILPELSMLIDEDGVMTHGSLHAGKLTFHKVKVQEFNPYSVPISAPKDRLPLVSLAGFLNSTAEMEHTFEALTNLKTEDFSLNESLSPSAQADRLPWRGFWWPRRYMPILGPLSKYDRFVEVNSGTNPGMASWERVHHPSHGVNWSGHCNGWAAAAILRNEPRFQKTDPRSGIIFSVSDQKGIMSEADYCVSATSYGTRNNGQGGGIRADIFHKTLRYYIGSLRKPIAMDINPGVAVENNVASGYTMDIIPNGPNTFNVTTTVFMHRYDNVASNVPGIASPYTRIYKYILHTDSSGNPISGSWLTSTPDFIWIPLTMGNCSNISNQWIDAISGL